MTIAIMFAGNECEDALVLGVLISLAPSPLTAGAHLKIILRDQALYIHRTLVRAAILIKSKHPCDVLEAFWKRFQFLVCVNMGVLVTLHVHVVIVLRPTAHLSCHNISICAAPMFGHRP